MGGIFKKEEPLKNLWVAFLKRKKLLKIKSLSRVFPLLRDLVTKL